MQVLISDRFHMLICRHLMHLFSPINLLMEISLATSWHTCPLHNLQAFGPWKENWANWNHVCSSSVMEELWGMTSISKPFIAYFHALYPLLWLFPCGIVKGITSSGNTPQRSSSPEAHKHRYKNAWILILTLTQSAIYAAINTISEPVFWLPLWHWDNKFITHHRYCRLPEVVSFCVIIMNCVLCPAGLDYEFWVGFE
jgi:hypothetical protein